jgi:hypothetical protein
MQRLVLKNSISISQDLNSKSDMIDLYRHQTTDMFVFVFSTATVSGRSKHAAHQTQYSQQFDDALRLFSRLSLSVTK